MKDRLATAGVLQFVERSRSQLLESPEEFFVETVLTDAAKLQVTEEVFHKLAAEFEAKGVLLDYIVRGLWEVTDVIYEDGQMPAGEVVKQGIFSARFRATLKSSGMNQSVWVELTPSGYEELERLGHGTDEELLKSLVRDFLKLQLSIGVASYWDPIRHPRQQFNDGAVLYLHHHPVPAG